MNEKKGFECMAFCNVEFFSRSLNRSVQCGVILPTDQGPYVEQPQKKPFPTLYLLHGMTGSQVGWYGMETLWDLANQYSLAVVMPNGENSFYADSPLTGAFYSTFISRELVEFTRNTFPLSHRREETFIGGLSMGDFGAIVNGLRNPETFGYITAFSSALIKRLILRSDEKEGLDYFTRIQYQNMFGLDNIWEFEGSDWDYDVLARKLAASGKEKPKIYMDCGTEDTSLYEANLDFRNLLLELGYDVTWDSRPGFHDNVFWNDSIKKAVDFLPVRKLEYAPDSPIRNGLTAMNEAMIRKMKK